MACTFLSQENKNQHAKKYSDMPVHTQRSFQHSNKHSSAGLQAVDLVLSKVASEQPSISTLPSSSV